MGLRVQLQADSCQKELGVFHFLTAGALKNLFLALGPTINTQPVYMYFGTYQPRISPFPSRKLGARFNLEVGFSCKSSPGEKGAIGAFLSSPAEGVALYSYVDSSAACWYNVWGANLIGFVSER